MVRKFIKSLPQAMYESWPEFFIFLQLVVTLLAVAVTLFGRVFSSFEITLLAMAYAFYYWCYVFHVRWDRQARR